MLELKRGAAPGAAIRALLDLAPKTARVLRDGKEEEVPLDQVVAGDQLRVRPGEKIPVDGSIIEGKQHRRGNDYRRSDAGEQRSGRPSHWRERLIPRAVS